MKDKSLKGILNKLVQDPELKKYPHSYNPIIIDRAEAEILKQVASELDLRDILYKFSANIPWNKRLAHAIRVLIIKKMKGK